MWRRTTNCASKIVVLSHAEGCAILIPWLLHVLRADVLLASYASSLEENCYDMDRKIAQMLFPKWEHLTAKSKRAFQWCQRTISIYWCQNRFIDFHASGMPCHVPERSILRPPQCYWDMSQHTVGIFSGQKQKFCAYGTSSCTSFLSYADWKRYQLQRHNKSYHTKKRSYVKKWAT